MILVDIYIPSLDKSYDFQLNESARVDTIIEEISEMVGQKERIQIVGDVSKLTLCDKMQRKVLPKEWSLAQCGIATGNSLILI